MNWTVTDIQLYEQEKEYVDTAVIPLIPLSFGSNMQSTVQKGEFISIFAEALEREYRGRLLLFPPFSYMSGQKEEESRLQEWAKLFKQNGMRHIVYITSDYEWKSASLDGHLFWLPAIPLDQLDDKAKQEVIGSQIREIMSVLTEKWENTE